MNQVTRLAVLTETAFEVRALRAMKEGQLGYTDAATGCKFVVDRCLLYAKLAVFPQHAHVSETRAFILASEN